MDPMAARELAMVGSRWQKILADNPKPNYEAFFEMVRKLAADREQKILDRLLGKTNEIVDGS